MLRRLCATAGLALGLGAVVLAGCAKEKVVSLGNLPPETTVFVKGDLDTVSHTIHIYWFGSDPDGDVLGYEYRFLNTSLPGQTAWSFTKRTDSVFAVPSIEDYSESLFEIRAIDNSLTPRPVDAAPGSPDGQRDATPDSALFNVTNVAPTVYFNLQTKPIGSDETFPTITLDWIGTDQDGDATSMRFQLGLDTIPSALRTVYGTSATLDTSQFKVAGAYPPTGPRTAWIRAIDDGGRASTWDKVTWIVRSPSSLGQRPRLLLIDDVATGSPLHDSLYYGAARRNLAPGSYAVLRLATSPAMPHVPFRNAENLAQTFMLFDAVVWYRGQVGIGGTPQPSTIMRNCQDGMATYLDHGRKLMLESLYLVEGIGGQSGAGALHSDWVTRYLGSTGLIRANLVGTVDSTVDWSINNGTVLTSSIYDMTLLNSPNNPGLRGFAVRDTHHVAAWARHNQLSPSVDRDIPVGLSVPVPDNPPGPGRIVVMTFALAGANQLSNPPDFADRIFADLGLNDLGPTPLTSAQSSPAPGGRRRASSP